MTDRPHHRRHTGTHDFRIGRTAYGWRAVWLSIPFLLAGGALASVGAGWLDPGETAGAPAWVIAVVGLAFFVAGALFAGLGLRGTLERRRAQRALRRDSAAPWFADYPWNERGVDDDPHRRWTRALALWCLAAAIMTPAHWVVLSDPNLPRLVAAILLLFDAAMAAALAAVVLRLLRAAKYGRARLGFRRFPFAPGGTVDVAFSPNRFDALSVTLRYVEERFESVGRGPRRRSVHRARVLFSRTTSVSPDPDRDDVPLSIELPAQLARATRLRADPDVGYWELLVGSRSPGIDFGAAFPLPVYDDAPASPVEPLAPLRRRRGALPFEVALPLAVVVFVAALAWIAPTSYRLLAGTLDGLRAGAIGYVELRPVRGTGADAMDVAVDADGTVWTLDKYTVTRRARGTDEALLNGRLHRSLFGAPMQSLSAIAVGDDGVAWLGGWRGSLYRGDGRGGWRRVDEAGADARGRVHALLVDDEALLVAAHGGLWRVPRTGLMPGRIDAVPHGSARALARSSRGAVAAAIGGEVWMGERGRWRRVWRGGEVQSLAPRGAGGWWIGTGDGLIEVDGTNVERVRHLAGRRVTALAESGSGDEFGLWVATWGAGLWHFDGVAWRVVDSARGLPDDSVSGVTASADGVWLAIYGEGFSRLDRTTFERIARDDPG